jgi:flagellar hook-associated protein 2
MSSGVVTANQISKTVQQALQSELQKIDAIRKEKTVLEDKKLAYTNIDSAIESLQDSLLALTRESTFATRTASSSNSNVVTASASTSAAKTSFTFSSVSQLATAARVTTANDLGLLSGTAPVLSTTVAGTYNPNLTISANSQSLSPLITSGAITINDTRINITGNDTLYSILTKINNSGAGVVALFDDATDNLRISGTKVGSEQALTFSSGNTNFFEALNLDDSLVEGTSSQAEELLDDVSSGVLAGVTNGFFNINNFTFEVRTDRDSMQSLINKVNSSNANAVMYFDDDTGKVTLTHAKTGEALILGNDTSGFLSAIGLMNQTADQNGSASASQYVGQKAEFVLNGETIQKDSNVFTLGGVTFSLVGTTNIDNPSATINVSTNPQATVDSVQSFVSQINATMSVLKNAINQEGGPLEKDTVLRRLMTTIRTGVLQKVDNPGQYGSLADLGFSFKRGSGIFTLEFDEEVFKSKLKEDETSVKQLFAFSSGNDGSFLDGGYAYSLRENMRNYTRTATGYFYKETDRLIDSMDRLSLKIFGMEEDVMDQEKRMIKRMVNQVQALQQLQAQGQKASQINSVVMSSLQSSAAGMFSASTA